MNDTDADARRVVKLLANLNCKVNLIALNPGPGIAFETPEPERVESFQGDCAAGSAMLPAKAARARYFCRLRTTETNRNYGAAGGTVFRAMSRCTRIFR